MGKARLIGLDWGTTSFRAYLMDGEGRILERLAEPQGILNVPNGDFAGTFERLVGPWLSQHGNLPVIASGMIGSRQGWYEAPYVECPATATEIAGKLVAVAAPAGRQVWLVPGLTYVGEDRVPDVMRGEETQIVGCLEAGATGQRIFLLPGTHSKWALVEGERILRFATFVTGELFAVLRAHSILGRLMQGEAPDAAAFRRGLDRAAGANQGLLRSLFSVRTLGLFDRLPAAGLASYLSGLLIGSEIAEARHWIAAEGGIAADTASTAITPTAIAPTDITIVGGESLAALYIDALTATGLSGQLAPADAVVPGLLRIARAATLQGVTP
jgi:2-dehydro-3-deoxygalactonokinase